MNIFLFIFDYILKERLGEPSEFSDAVVSIVGSSYLTGCVIRLDGGLRVPHI
jgi:NAD(P)-dependent dehydrogenase (short-subunit alcohol dehydrogenase family)